MPLSFDPVDPFGDHDLHSIVIPPAMAQLPLRAQLNVYGVFVLGTVYLLRKWRDAAAAVTATDPDADLEPAYRLVYRVETLLKCFEVIADSLTACVRHAPADGKTLAFNVTAEARPWLAQGIGYFLAKQPKPPPPDDLALAGAVQVTMVETTPPDDKHLGDWLARGVRLVDRLDYLTDVLGPPPGAAGTGEASASDQSGWYSMKAAAERLGQVLGEEVEIWRITRLIQDGKVKDNGKQRRERRVDPASLLDYAAERTRAADMEAEASDDVEEDAEVRRRLDEAERAAVAALNWRCKRAGCGWEGQPPDDVLCPRCRGGLEAVRRSRQR